MFCIQCGVKLADTEKKCPLCGTAVYHPELKQADVPPLYPQNRHPKPQANPQIFNGLMVILFLIPLLICFLADLKRNGELNWFGYAAGGILLLYIVAALPLWFKKPNPVIFVPCDFFALILFLFYINYTIGSAWFWNLALPLMGTLGIIICAMVTLIHYLRKGRLYIFGGGFIALGGWMMMIELLIAHTFDVVFIGWAFYPLIVLALTGGALIYLAINRSAREMMERKLFF